MSYSVWRGRCILLIIGTLFFLMIGVQYAQADQVKPALVEITTQADGQVKVEIRASIEALLTGINARFTNTQDAPQAAEYDVLRKLPADQLYQQFVEFVPDFLAAIRLTADDQPIVLQLDDVQIPAPGYTQVPRISRLSLSGHLPAARQHVRWFYPAVLGDNAVRLRQVDVAAEIWLWSDWQWIRDNQPSQPFALQATAVPHSSLQHIVEYTQIGFAHIIPLGMDHLLFIVGLFLFGGGWRALFWQVSLFTLAHSVTLGLGLTGWVHVSSVWVEPLIAASIVFIALENIDWRGYRGQTKHSIAEYRPIAYSRLSIVFGFGLLHGLGFAEMLSAFGMPTGAFVPALIGFNLGVELGQLTVIATAFVLTAWFRSQAYYYRRIVMPGSIGIALVGLLWTLERLSS